MDDREINRAIATGRMREVRVKMVVVATVLVPAGQDVCELDPAGVIESFSDYDIEEM